MLKIVKVPAQMPDRTPCKLAFVGEAPGDDEINHRSKLDTGGTFHDPQPLVGPAGGVFNAALRTASLQREQYLITNVFDEKADDNECGPWMRDPAIYEPAFKRLAEEIEAAQPNLIVPMGGTALWAFTGYTGIDQFRGAVTKATRVAKGMKLLPTVHPARILRQWKLLPVMVGDFIKAAAEAEKGPKITYPKVRLMVDPTIEEVVNFLHECAHSDLLSCDIETGWGMITCIGFAPTPDLAMCVPFVDMRQPDRSYWRTPEEEVLAWQAVRGVLECPVPKLFQNGNYDAFWIIENAGIRLNNYCEDTRLMHHALFPELPKDLASMAGSYADVGSWKHFADYKGEKKDA